MSRIFLSSSNLNLLHLPQPLFSPLASIFSNHLQPLTIFLPPTSSALVLISGLSRMNDAKTQSFLKRIVALVVMQKMVIVKQAEAGNKAVGRFSNGHSQLPEDLKVLD